MHSQFLIAAVLAAYGVAVPLNINLGAYSPALVVGDGEISFGGKADVSNLMNALEGAAVGGAAANAPKAAAAPSVAENQQAAQIASLQGMGKEIAPRVVKLEAREPVVQSGEDSPIATREPQDEVPTTNSKRDINGFNAALKYATDAIKITPQIDIGTKAAGVGILQRPGITAAVAAGGRPAAKRDIQPRKVKTTVTTMYIRGGPVPPLPAGAEKRSVEETAELSKREPSPSSGSGIDGVNLNMADGQVAELTFVETRSVDDEADPRDD